MVPGLVLSKNMFGKYDLRNISLLHRVLLLKNSSKMIKLDFFKFGMHGNIGLKALLFVILTL